MIFAIFLTNFEMYDRRSTLMEDPSFQWTYRCPVGGCIDVLMHVLYMSGGECMVCMWVSDELHWCVYDALLCGAVLCGDVLCGVVLCSALLYCAVRYCVVW
jgi:hypothetical protein